MKIRKHKYSLALLMLIVFLCGCESGGNNEKLIIQERRGTAAEKETEIETEAATEETKVQQELFVLLDIDTEKKEVTLQKVGSNRETVYTYDTGTEFLDKYGNSFANTSLVPGDVAKVQAMGGDAPIKSLQLSDEVWVQDGITNYSLDTDINALIIGKTKYKYDEDLLVFSNGEQVKLKLLGDSDEIRVVGLDKEIISVSITRGHGTLVLSNTKIFEGSFICIGEKIFLEVTPNMQVEVPEGKYLVTVANNGYGGSREVKIKRNKTTSLNLDELKGEGPKMCKITFKVGVEGAILQLDGKSIDYSKPVEVQYGVHKIAVTAEGYDNITEKLVVNSKEAEIEIALTSASESEEKEKEESDSEKEDEESSETKTSKKNNQKTNTNKTNTNSNEVPESEEEDTTDYLTTLYNLLNSINDKSEWNGLDVDQSVLNTLGE